MIRQDHFVFQIYGHHYAISTSTVAVIYQRKKCKELGVSRFTETGKQIFNDVKNNPGYDYFKELTYDDIKNHMVEVMLTPIEFSDIITERDFNLIKPWVIHFDKSKFAENFDVSFDVNLLPTNTISK